LHPGGASGRTRPLVTGEVLKSVLFEFVRTNAEGAEEVFHTIRLTNASVSEIAQHIAFEPTGADVPELEDVSLTFQKIEVENKPGKTMAEDSVGGR
jgi:type VI secretion system Hcp family effector